MNVHFLKLGVLTIFWPPYQEIGRAFGAVAQSGERLVCNQEVVGSIPIGSTRAKRL